MPDTTLDPHDRRTMVRREDDRTFLQHCADLATHHAKWLAIVTAAVSVLAWSGALVGIRFSGPPDAMLAAAAQHDNLAERVTRLEEGAEATRGHLGRLTYDVKFLSYLLCMKDRGRDPLALDRCQPIIESIRARSSP